ncbi:hypothetical protein Tco_0625061 [Tanacetum coccineum]|uniref:Uncharacterized protein n=1 Tax=Tanacetum coccineum TaxID=301880 RepID=A0ABQ4WFQ6_9ASTR
MTHLMDASGQTYQPFDSTLVGSSGLSFQRRVRPRTGDASTSAAPHTDAIKTGTAARSACLSVAHLSARPAPAESTQKSSHLSGSQSADHAQLEHQPAPICLQHGPSGTLSPVPVPQLHRPLGLTPQW